MSSNFPQYKTIEIRLPQIQSVQIRHRVIMSHLRELLLACCCGLALTLANAEQMVKLSSGHYMPIIGLGTWQMKQEDVGAAVTAALEDGYRHIDTALVYENEEAIGRSLKKWFDKGNKREDVFITTKLPPFGLRGCDVERFLNMSLTNLGLNYVDMYLIHTPIGITPYGLDFATDLVATWKAMEDQVKAGRIKSIGLSNFNESQVLKIFNNAEIKPSNLQIELHAYNQQKPLRELCAKLNISVTAFSNLGSPGSAHLTRDKGVPNLMGHPTIKKIAEAHKKTPAQVLLRHSVQNGIIVIPKSTKAERIKENHDIFDFELTADEMKQINDLDKGEEGRIFDFLDMKGIENHPEYPWTSQIKKAWKKES